MKPYRLTKEDSKYWGTLLNGAQLHTDLRLPPLAYQLSTSAPFLKEKETPKNSSAEKKENKRLTGRLCFKLEPQLEKKLKGWVQSEKTVLPVVLASAWNAFLYRYFEQEDITIYYASSVRPKGPEILTELLPHTFLLRTTLSPEMTFRQLVEKVSKQYFENQEHRFYPYPQLVAHLKKTGADFVLPNTGIAQVIFKSLETRFDKEMMADLILLYDDNPENQTLTLGLEYRKSLLAEPFVHQMKDHFLLLLNRMIDELDKPLTQIPLLSETEMKQQLIDWNQTEQKYPANKTIIQLFEEQAQKTPHNVAIVFEEKELTYQEINERANQLAHDLIEQKVCPETIIGICMDRNPEMIISLLGIFKAGGAYVPIDPQYPPERIQYILRDSGVKWVLTQLKYKSHFQEKAICLEEEAEKIAKYPTNNPSSSLLPHHLAYVIYTSGSSGAPKGVLGEHRPMINRFHWMWQKYPFEKHEVNLAKTSLSFLDSVWEIFGFLLQGVPTILLPQSHASDANYMDQLIRKKHVTRLVLVPSLLFALLEIWESQGGFPPSLKVITCSGEALNNDLIVIYNTLKYRPTLLNIYGSSELTADVTCYEVPANDQRGTSLIGKPIDNVQIYVCDSHWNPMPVGLVGELFVGGIAVARGYYQRPDLTQERFIHHPFSQDPHARLFKTGDLVRYLPDGNIEYIGRIDFQVKLRGFRIELGEIESALLKIPSVQQATVILREDQGNKYLAAYIVPSIEKPEATRKKKKTKEEVQLEEALRQALSKVLPGYMVPSTFTVLEKLPLTTSGKIDRLALPKPNQSQKIEEAYNAPRSELERTLAILYAKILGVEKVGITDNFFYLGGHSLTAIRLINLIKNQCDVDVPLPTFYKKPTIKQLASFINQMKERDQPKKACLG